MFSAASVFSDFYYKRRKHIFSSQFLWLKIEKSNQREKKKSMTSMMLTSLFAHEVSEHHLLSVEYDDGGIILQDTCPVAYGRILAQCQ